MGLGFTSVVAFRVPDHRQALQAVVTALHLWLGCRPITCPSPTPPSQPWPRCPPCHCQQSQAGERHWVVVRSGCNGPHTATSLVLRCQLCCLWTWLFLHAHTL